jgi:glycosyltransferase involved in cell wall biosynthesis
LRSTRLLTSVVVPTRDRPVPLGACLDALSAQTAAEWLEVIVVDDGSVAADEVAAVVARHPRARLVRGAGSGPAAARNEGARQARGAILCFTDDDCVPEVDWVEQLTAAIEQGLDAVAGTTLSDGGALADASELVAQAPAAARPSDGGALLFAPSNNLACTKAAFDEVPFDESYPEAAGEDREWCARLLAGGFAFGSEPAARVVHRQDLTLRKFLRRQVRYGQGAYRFRRRNRDGRLEPFGFYTALLRRAFAQGFTGGLLVTVAQAATALGFVRGWAALRREDGAVTARDRADASGSRRDAS